MPRMSRQCGAGRGPAAVHSLHHNCVSAADHLVQPENAQTTALHQVTQLNHRDK